MEKRGDIWVSAILYLALGIVAIALVLGAVTPLINKIRERNTIVQSKDIMYTVDRNIRTVINEGPGSQRYLSPFVIEAGEFSILDNNDQILWSMKTKNEMIEKGMHKEGVLNLYLNETNVEGVYLMNLMLDYNGYVDIQLKSDGGNPFQGRWGLIIRNEGVGSKNLPVIILEMI